MCLVAIFALSALVAATASAAPEYKTCVKAEKVGRTYPSGEFSDKACSVASPGGKYKLGAWNEGKKTTNKGKGTNPVNRQIYPALKEAVADVECTSEKTAGAVTGPSSGETKAEYKGCKDSEGKNCNTKGEGKGKIHTEQLVTALIDQPGAAEGIGIIISPKSGTTLATYECEGGLKVTAIGGVFGEVEGGATKGAVKQMNFKFSKGDTPYQQFGYAGADEAENGSKFEEFFGSEGAKGTAPTAAILSHIEGNTNPALPPEFTLPATQEGLSEVKGEALKIVG
jgi:hypothetical protein